MISKTVFIDLVRKINSGNASHTIDRLESYLDAETVSDLEAASVVQHLETLGFYLEGSEQFGDAVRAYDLIVNVSPQDQGRGRHLVANAKVQDLIERKLWDDALSVVTEILSFDKQGTTRRDWILKFLGLGWSYECKHSIEAAVQCYRFAFELNGSDAGLTTGDGNTLSTKIRNLRILQMNQLADAGLHEEAAALHNRTRSITRLNPVDIYSIVSARQAASGGRGVYHELWPSRKITEPDVSFLGGPVKLTSQAGLLVAPPQYIAFFKNCVTFPRSNVVLQGERLIYDLAAHPLNAIAEIKDGINPDQIMQAVFGKGRALVELPSQIANIDAGLMLFGFQSKNYGHWILEFAPRMLWFNDPACPSDFPICIDNHMPETHRQIIELIDERNRQILPLQPQATRFKELGVAPVPAFFPFDCRPGYAVYDTVWPSDVLTVMRRKVLERLPAPPTGVRKPPSKIFLSRRGFAQRQLLNEAEIIATLTCRGFEVVYPEKLSLLEQITLFSEADVVVGSASSALTNCIFCKPNARVVALIHDNRAFNFRGYTSMIESSGARLLFVRGETISDEKIHAFHANYRVPPEQVLRALAAITP